MIDHDDLYERASGESHEDQWISLSDLMSSLMMIFMLISIAYMLKTEADAGKLKDLSAKAQQEAAKSAEQSAKVQQIAITYTEIKNQLYDDLNAEFKDDFKRWGATLDMDLTIRFNNEYILFNRGDDQLKIGFQDILQNFFPRYLRIITSGKYRSTIQEVRIEGHTSHIWSDKVTPQEAYFKNMELSQARTRAALRYVMDLPTVQNDLEWLKTYVTANGLSSSHPILNPDGTENEALSQRVEFRIRTDAESRINNILDSAAF